MLKLAYTNQFKKDYKKNKKSGNDISSQLIEVIDSIRTGKKLPKIYRDHKLHGNYKNRRELHIQPNLLLIYKIDEGTLILERMGSHSELFD